MPDFVHLHLHTEYSLLDGACRIDELLDQAVKLKMPAIAVTEHGNPGETQNHLVLLAENSEGYHNLIKLVSAGYTEGFYYRPRIDKELLASHANGLIGLSSCLKGEVASALKVEQEKR